MLPNATETKIFVTANGRALRHFIEMRGDPAADVEIRKVAVTVLKLLQAESPNLFGDYTVTRPARRRSDGVDAAPEGLSERRARAGSSHRPMRRRSGRQTSRKPTRFTPFELNDRDEVPPRRERDRRHGLDQVDLIGHVEHDHVKPARVVGVRRDEQ